MSENGLNAILDTLLTLKQKITQLESKVLELESKENEIDNFCISDKEDKSALELIY
jgi:hypothetical protein